METETFIRNGIRITMPIKQKPFLNIPQRAVEASVHRYPNRGRSCIKMAAANKKCMRCGAPSWRSDVQYCWECYKYENFESR